MEIFSYNFMYTSSADFIQLCMDLHIEMSKGKNAINQRSNLVILFEISVLAEKLFNIKEKYTI